jgi:YrbI family 3-deoxy-D-manno-octulosonate 8-phosphate phosphatase
MLSKISKTRTVRDRVATYKLRQHERPKLLAIDFDGCLTDDHVLVDENGNEFVKVSRKDGLGASRLRLLGVIVLIISSERNLVVSKRAEKIQVEVLQDIKNKQAALQEFASSRGITQNEIWAVGNDINDLGLLNAVGFALCPADASEEVKSVSDMVLPIRGGEGILNYLARAMEKQE